MPKVSVLMSIYKPDERYLAQQLESIDAQDFDDMDVIVYNDCPESTGCESFCREHCTRHELKYEDTNQNRGFIKAFEHLVELADGEYLVLCDQDDIWLPGRIERGVEALDQGYTLAVCDRQIIDGEGEVVEQSWRAAHPNSPELTWKSGDHYAPYAATTCYAIGMATMVRADVARELLPFPEHSGHDKWLALGANAMGPCANIEEPLVQYRRHGKNVSGSFSNISTKADWRLRRVIHSYELAQEFVKHFPDSPDCEPIMGFAQARMDGSIRGLWRYRYLAPQTAKFEILMRFLPEKAFEALVRKVKG